MSGVLRSTDTAYRYGGEELVVLLRETGLEDATTAAERLREAVGCHLAARQPPGEGHDVRRCRHPSTPG